MKVTGRFDDVFAARARCLFDSLAAAEHDVSIDMSEAADLDAGGLAALVRLHKGLERRGRKVRVVGVAPGLLRLFEKFQIADLFIEGAVKPKSSAMRSCFFGIQAPEPAASVSAPDGVKRATEAKPEQVWAGATEAASNVVPFEGARLSVKAWLDTVTTAGGELRGSDALKSYKRWAAKVAKDTKSADLRRILTSILGAERVVARTSGYVVKGLPIRSAAAGGVRPAA
jgi:anti-anti-sigma regulatory factor